MPNWADGTVRITGRNKKNVEDFCKYFIFEEECGTKKAPYFGRSFIHQSWKDFKKDFLGGTEAEFGVDFAWSAASCLISGYPTKKGVEPVECITLMDACKKHKVYVVIETCEPGMAFEETLECNEKGELVVDESRDMPSYTCKCGNEQSMRTDADLSDEECWECGKIGQWKKPKEAKK